MEKSSPQGLNKTQCYNGGEGFQYYEFKVLEKFFIKLSKIGKYHHFYFSVNKLGIVRVKKFANSSWEVFDLLKTDGRERKEILKEIRKLMFPILKPKPLSLERKEYLYKEFRPLLPKECLNNTLLQSIV